MASKAGRALLLAARLLLAGAFLIEGADKFSGSRLWVRIFTEIGFGQWFRYFTGGVEIIGALLLLFPHTAWIGAALLVCTMIGALLAHVLVIGIHAQTIVVVVLLCVLSVVGVASRKAPA